MNRKQFAECVAQAYMDQYHHQEWRRDPVMNNPAIDYDFDRETFGSCSSLTPPTDAELRVLDLEDGIFGSENTTKAGLKYYLMHDDELWNQVVRDIEECRNGR